MSWTTNWNCLPEEIKSKIMYSGYIRHPTAYLIDNIDYIPYNSIASDITETHTTFIEHLSNIGILNKYYLYDYDLIFYFFDFD